MASDKEKRSSYVGFNEDRVAHLLNEMDQQEGRGRSTSSPSQNEDKSNESGTEYDFVLVWKVQVCYCISHLPHISLTSPSHLPHISLTSPAHLPHISLSSP